MSPRLAGIIRFVFWSVNALLLGAFFMAISFGMGLPKVAIWWIGLCVAWGLLSQVFINMPLMRWVAKTLFHGEPSIQGRHVKGPFYVRGRMIIRLKNDTSTLEWKTGLLTLLNFVWISTSTIFMTVVVFRPIAIWLAEVF